MKPSDPLIPSHRRPRAAGAPGFWARHPYLTVSALAHLGLVAVLLLWGGQLKWAEQTRRDQALFARTAERAEAIQLERRSSALEALQRKLSGQGGEQLDADQPPLSRAQQLERARAATASVRPSPTTQGAGTGKARRDSAGTSAGAIGRGHTRTAQSGDIDVQLSALEKRQRRPVGDRPAASARRAGQPGQLGPRAVGDDRARRSRRCKSRSRHRRRCR